MLKKNVLICGATGYIGLQLTKLLCKHKHMNIKYLCGSSSVGKKIDFYDKDLKKFKLPKISKFNKKKLSDVDIIFTALPNGEAQSISKYLNKNNLLIDLAADFRLNTKNEYVKWYKIKHSASNLIKNSIYSIPEISGKLIKKFKIISCPGCYPTTVLIPLIPLIKRNLIKNKTIIIDSKSGYSGAGRGVHKKYKNKNLYESLSAYGLANHRHNSEIQQELDLKTGKKNKFHFTPHLTPMFRGILSTIYVDIKKGASLRKVQNVLINHYKSHKFVKISKTNTFLSTNDVINTNNCLISVCNSKYRDKIIILSAIDNLIKGGGGQAVQNMNYYFNFNESEGLNV